MHLITKISLAIVAVWGISSCATKGPDVSNVQADFELVPFFMELHSIAPDSIAAKVPYLRQKYGHYLEGYSTRVIKIGPSDAPEYPEYLRSFIEYDANRDVFAKCKEQYADLSLLKQQITGAYRHYLHYFPTYRLPDVYLHISGFNQSMVADSGLIAVSVEKYLGADCPFYEWLAYPNYLRRKMVPQKMVPDLMKAIAYTEFPYNDSIDDVANNIIYQGKVLYFVKAMIPALHDSLLFDYTERELEWCDTYETKMWETMVEKKYLFDNNRMAIQKFIGDAPFTTYFGQDSPGRAGTYVGYRIVEAYLKRNPAVGLPKLMEISDGHEILRGSGYRP
ncbi:MAG: gliding motility protein GldB [Breznakibacter sp.]